jgi:anthranilate/para-aminobenzoate synthase component II
MEPKRIGISLGTGTPKDEKHFGVYKSITQPLKPSRPTCVICLGHQDIIHAFIGNMYRVKKFIQSKNCAVRQDSKAFLSVVRNPFLVTRRHSFVGERDSILYRLKITIEAC